MKKNICVKLNEKVLVFRPALGGPRGGARHSFVDGRWSSTVLSFHGIAEVRASLPSEWFAAVDLAAHARGVSLPVAPPLPSRSRSVGIPRKLFVAVNVVSRDGARARMTFVVRYRRVTADAAPATRACLRQLVHDAAREFAAALTYEELAREKESAASFVQADARTKAIARGIAVAGVSLRRLDERERGR